MSEILPYIASEALRLSERVKQTIVGGGIVAIPTETFYGLGVNPFSRQAVERLLRVKERPHGKPILLLIGAREQLPLLTEVVDPAATVLMDAFWPGPLTILYPARSSLPTNLTAGTNMVGVRLTSLDQLQDILRRVGPLTGTSANRSGDQPVTTAGEVLELLGCDVDLVIDAGRTPGQLPSTVVDTRGAVRVIREGAVTRQMLQNVLQTRGISLT